MSPAERQLERLDQIARSLQARPAAQALIALGSVGRALERLDEYSDLDFFVIVEPGNKQAFLDDLDWLSAVRPIAYSFKNTEDGFKLLFEDSIFCEMAIFEPPELVHIPFASGRVIWKRDSVSPAIGEPQPLLNLPAGRSLEWLLGEALTNLYVGLCRYRRGEKLSAVRFIQGYTVDRVIELTGLIAQPAASSQDPFSFERRYEQRYPQFASQLDHFIQGYERSPQSAEAILAFLQEHFTVNQALARAILSLCKD
jgi:lincosamide nucleotidyltransferase B/F